MRQDKVTRGHARRQGGSAATSVGIEGDGMGRGVAVADSRRLQRMPRQGRLGKNPPTGGAAQRGEVDRWAPLAPEPIWQRQTEGSWGGPILLRGLGRRDGFGP
jgi:hypothetical protein